MMIWMYGIVLFLQHYTLVAVEENLLVGFGDIDKIGYLDRLYVHKTCLFYF